MSIRTKYFPYALMVVLVLSACAEKTAVPPVLTPPAIGVTISDSECAFIEVQPGTQVAWTNDGDEVAVVQAEAGADGSRMFDSGELQPGDSFMFTFVEPGRYNYQCSPDGTANGTVTVLP
jgi:plastocyanin